MPHVLLAMLSGPGPLQSVLLVLGIRVEEHPMVSIPQPRLTMVLPPLRVVLVLPVLPTNTHLPHVRQMLIQYSQLAAIVMLENMFQLPAQLETKMAAVLLQHVQPVLLVCRTLPLILPITVLPPHLVPLVQIALLVRKLPVPVL